MSDATNQNPPLALVARDAPVQARKSIYPAHLAVRVEGRIKRPLGRIFGLSGLGVNLTTLAPGAQSALMHRHTRAEEFVYVVEGRPTLQTDTGEVQLAPGMCAGFPPGGVAHHLVNQTDEDVVYLEIGTNPPDDVGEFPEDDLLVERNEAGGWRVLHKDGRAY